MNDPVQRARQFVQSAFAEMQATDDLNETALIRDGHYCGQRFFAGEVEAVWFFEEDEIKIYQGQELVRVASLAPETPAYRRAA